MLPIRSETIPHGDEWVYQLKWDGVRILASVDHGHVELYSRRMLPKKAVYPEVIGELSQFEGRLLLDGEVIYFDPQTKRPNFQKVLQREKAKGISALSPHSFIAYVLFDLLIDGQADLRNRPYIERYERLTELFPAPSSTLFVSDLFSDGTALWEWVNAHGWEGIVSKRRSSVYREGKQHRDWYKTKTMVYRDVHIVGVIIREGRVASLVMALDTTFFGSVSLGLDEADKRKIIDYATSHASAVCPFPLVPAGLNKEDIIWLAVPFSCRVKGLEITSAGMLRHPQIEQFPLN